MATKGYHQYRGRGRGGKTLLVLLLLLILLGACAFLFLQRYIVYHDDGSISIELPFDFSRPQEEPDPIPPEDVNVEREDPEDTPPPADEPEPLVLSALHAQELTYGCLYSDPTWQLQGQEAVVVNVKRQDGTIAYYTGISLPDNVLRGNEATGTHLQTIAQSSCYTVARMSVMCDSAYAAAVPSAAISYTYGGLWVDNYNRFWLDPTNEQVIAHICALAKECADLGFDEILLDHLRYPIEGSLSQTTVTSDTDRAAAIANLAGRVREAVGPQVAVSIILPGSIGTDYSFAQSGLTAQVLAESFDRIFVPEASSSYYWVDQVLPAEYDRTTRLVVTSTYAAAPSYMITQ